MRLLKRGMMIRANFCAVRGGTSGAEIVAERDFPQEAKKDITLDHLDPAVASTDPFNPTVNREWAMDTLRDLDELLAMKSRRHVGRLEDHWYSRLYTKPVILWNEPIAVTSTEQPRGIARTANVAS